MRVVIGNGAWWGSEEIGEEVSFWEDWETKGAARRSRWGWGWDDSNGGNNNGRREVLNRDVGKQDALDDFFKLLVDVCILGFGIRVLKLRTREVVLLGCDVGENFKEVGWGGNKDRRSGGNRDDGRRIDNEQGKEGGWADGRVREDGGSKWGGCVAVRTWIVPSVVGAIEEVLDNLVGGSDVYLIDVVNLQPRGDREGGGGDGGGSGGGDKRR